MSRSHAQTEKEPRWKWRWRFVVKIWGGRRSLVMRCSDYPLRRSGHIIKWNHAHPGFPPLWGISLINKVGAPSHYINIKEVNVNILWESNVWGLLCVVSICFHFCVCRFVSGCWDKELRPKDWFVVRMEGHSRVGEDCCPKLFLSFKARSCCRHLKLSAGYSHPLLFLIYAHLQRRVLAATMRGAWCK